MRDLLTVACFGLLISLSGCLSAELAEVQRELEEQQVRWQDTALERYQFTFQWICFCPPEYTTPMQIAVRDETIERITVLETGESVPPARFQDYHSISGLFDFLENVIERKPANIAVTYDALGYPTKASIDYRDNVSDDELSFTVENFSSP